MAAELEVTRATLRSTQLECARLASERSRAQDTSKGVGRGSGGSSVEADQRDDYADQRASASEAQRTALVAELGSQLQSTRQELDSVKAALRREQTEKQSLILEQVK